MSIGTGQDANGGSATQAAVPARAMATTRAFEKPSNRQSTSTKLLGV
jgi:hypothetical protein